MAPRIIFIIALFPLVVLAAETFDRDLYFGMKNDPDVVRLQEFLRKQGYFTYPESTGNYLEITVEAVKKFQERVKLEPVGGYFGARDREEVNQILIEEEKRALRQKPPPPPPPPPSDSDFFERDLYYGLKNDPEVVKLQEFLKSQGFFDYPEITGNYFSVTINSVIKFQQVHNIQPAQGYFGPLTRTRANQIITVLQGFEGPALSESATSTYYGKIKLSSVSGKSVNPIDERIVITNNTRDESVNITGWKIINIQNHTIKIPRVYNLPGLPTSELTDLVLPPGGRVTITIGKQERRMNFQENMCTGYFNQTSKFIPGVSGSCPRPDITQLYEFSDKCLQTIGKVGSCRTPDVSLFFGIDNKCVDFMVQNFSYIGCVSNYRNNAKFFSNRWLVWMQMDKEIFRNTYDKIILEDNFGKLVDEKRY